MKIKYNPKMQIIVELIHLLYDLPDCSAGGCCHIVTDDDNIEDNDLKFVIEYCNNPDNSNIDKELSRTICELLLQLSREQRICLFYLMNAGQLDEGVNDYTWDYLLAYYKTADEMLSDWDNGWNW